MKYKKYNRIILVGAGISNLTVARFLSQCWLETMIIEKRDKVGGACSSHFENGIEVHDFGPHIFHTSSDRVEQFIKRFTKFNNYRHHVVTKVNGQTYFMPFNLSLINQFYGKAMSPSEARQFIADVIEKDRVENPKNLEEQAISLVGKDLYENFIKYYTMKQWNTHPRNLDPSIIKRIPIRYDFNTEYFNDSFIGIPLKGYQNMLDTMATDAFIYLKLNTEFKIEDAESDTLYVYSGQIDRLLDYRFGELEWRSIRFDTELLKDCNDYQGCSVINYPGNDVQFTRINEYKHYHPETKDSLNDTVICKEYPQDFVRGKTEPFYPVLNERNRELYNKYLDYLKTNYPNIRLCGRLAEYKYYDMDDAIERALQVGEEVVNEYINAD